MRAFPKFAALLGVSLAAALAAPLPQADYQIDLIARERVFPEFTTGVSALKRDAAGRYALLPARGPLLILDADGKRLAQIPAEGSPPASSLPAPASAFLHADDFDFDPEGRVFIADRGANKVLVFSADGKPERAVDAPAPTSIAALAEGEVAVTPAVQGYSGLREEPLPRAVSVYDARGKLVRQFVSPVELAERPAVNRLLNLGRLVPGPRGALYYFFVYLPEPTVRKFDRFGFSDFEIVIQSLDFMPIAQAVRRQIAQEDKRRSAPVLKPVVNALGVDASNDDLWLAIGNVLLHFDREGTRRGSYRAFTTEGVRLEPSIVLVEKERLILGADPQGFYAFAHPVRAPRTPPAKKSGE